MNPPPMRPAPERATPAADALLSTLQETGEALGLLDATLERQFSALNDNQIDALEQAAAQTHEVHCTLDQLYQKQTRQMRLLGRVIGLDDAGAASVEAIANALGAQSSDGAGGRLSEAWAAVRKRAHTAQHRGEALDFALQYASGLNRTLMTAMHNLAAPPPARTYTATGRTEEADAGRSFVNQMG